MLCALFAASSGASWQTNSNPTTPYQIVRHDAEPPRRKHRSHGAVSSRSSRAEHAAPGACPLLRDTLYATRVSRSFHDAPAALHALWLHARNLRRRARDDSSMVMRRLAIANGDTLGGCIISVDFGVFSRLSTVLLRGCLSHACKHDNFALEVYWDWDFGRRKRWHRPTVKAHVIVQR